MSGLRKPWEILHTISRDLDLLREYAEKALKVSAQRDSELQEKIWEWKIKQAQFERLWKIKMEEAKKRQKHE